MELVSTTKSTCLSNLVKTMPTHKHYGWGPGAVIGAIAVTALVIFGALYVGSGGRLFSIGGGTVTQVSTQSGSCPASGFTNLQLKGTYVSPANSFSVVQPAVTSGATVFVDSQNTGFTVNLPSSGYAFLNNTVPCGHNVTVVWGNEASGFYLQGSAKTQVGGAATTIVNSALLPIAQLSSVTFSNTIVTGQTSVSQVPAGNGIGYVFGLRISSGSGIYGPDGTIVTLSYLPTEFSSVYLSGSGVQSISTSLPTATLTTANAVPAGYITSSYLLSGLSWGNYSNYNVNVRTLSLNGNAVISNPVTVYVNDYVNFLNSGVLTQQSYNPATYTDLGAYIWTTVNAINVYS